jgi:hypothetical protein
MSHNQSLYTRNNNSGYRQYSTDGSNWKYTHRTVAEKKVGRELVPGEHVHHINKDKTDNRPVNLAVIDKDIHKHLHQSEVHEQNACFRCGHTSHWADQCFAAHDVYGRSIITEGTRNHYIPSEDDDSDGD